MTIDELEVIIRSAEAEIVKDNPRKANVQYIGITGGTSGWDLIADRDESSGVDGLLSDLRFGGKSISCHYNSLQELADALCNVRGINWRLEDET